MADPYACNPGVVRRELRALCHSCGWHLNIEHDSLTPETGTDEPIRVHVRTTGHKVIVVNNVQWSYRPEAQPWAV